MHINKDAVSFAPDSGALLASDLIGQVNEVGGKGKTESDALKAAYCRIYPSKILGVPYQISSSYNISDRPSLKLEVGSQPDMSILYCKH